MTSVLKANENKMTGDVTDQWRDQWNAATVNAIQWYFTK